MTSESKKYRISLPCKCTEDCKATISVLVSVNKIYGKNFGTDLIKRYTKKESR